MMLPAFLLANLFILLCKPWMANYPSIALSVDSNDYIDVSLLQFIDFEPYGISDITPWKDVISVFAIVALVWLLIYHIGLIKEDKKELKVIQKSFENAHSKVMEVSQFHKDTEALFSLLEERSKRVHKRFKKAKQVLSKNCLMENLREDIRFIKDSWCEQFYAISRLNIDFTKNTVSEMEFKAQLVMAKGIVDREISNVKDHMDEDCLSLEVVQRDVKFLQRHFGK